MELTLLTGAKAAFIACFLPQPTLEHAQMCNALADLTTALPHLVIILGGDMQGTWAGISPTSIRISSLPYKKSNGSMTPTFQPCHRPDQSSCIDHLTIWDPRHIARQKGATQTIPSAFLNHHGLLGRVHLPILTAEDIVPPNAQLQRVTMFQYPISEHILEE